VFKSKVNSVNELSSSKKQAPQKYYPTCKGGQLFWIKSYIIILSGLGLYILKDTRFSFFFVQKLEKLELKIYFQTLLLLLI
jgi:hypothetical protein